MHAQANTAINSGATQRLEAFTDVDINLCGEAAASYDPTSAPTVNGHAAPPDAPQVGFPFELCLIQQSL
jgi:hypothetical protein